MRPFRIKQQLILLSCLTGLTATCHSAQPSPVISIIIDDMGYKLQRGIEAINLPGAFTYAFLPHLEHSTKLAALAHQSNKEVILHLPMQAVTDARLDPGALTIDMDKQTFTQTLQDNIQAVPHISGINNHMGSLLTQNKNQMQWLMEVINQDKALFFVDSYTTKHSVAQQIALDHAIPSARRDIFLDNDPDAEQIRKQYKRLIKRAKSQGSAIAIAHPRKNTLKVLAEMIQQLESHGLTLISVKQLINNRNNRENLWQASLSHSPKAVKN